MSAHEVLEQRARALARPLATTDAAASRQVLQFRYDGAGYAVPLTAVRSVVPLTGAARLPADARPLVAVGAVAGEIVPVLGLGTRDTGARGSTWGIAVEAADVTLCLPADDVAGIVELRDDELTTTAPADDPGDGRAGAITTRGDVLLDVDALVSSLTRQRSGAHAEDRRSADDSRDPR